MKKLITRIIIWFKIKRCENAITRLEMRFVGGEIDVFFFEDLWVIYRDRIEQLKKKLP